MAKIKKIVPYSFVLCVFVVIIHNPTKAYFTYENTILSYYSHLIISDIIPAITTVAVPSFFIISAYFFYRNYSYDKTLDKYKSRFYSLVIPYIFWNTFSLIIEMITKIPAIAAFSVDTSNPFILKNIVFGIFMHKYNVFWFVFALIIYNMFCFAFYSVLNKKGVGIITMLGVFLLYSFRLIDIKLPGNCYFQTDSLIYYMIGAYCGIHYKELFSKRFNVKSRIVAALVMFFAVCADIAYTTENLMCDFVLILIRGVCLWVILDNLGSLKRDCWWMKITFFIYAMHPIVGRVITTVVRLSISYTTGLFGGSELLIFIVSVSLTVLTCIFIAWLWRKLSRKSFEIVTGNRG